MIGGLLAGLGMTMSSLTTNVELLLLTYSCVMGMVNKVKALVKNMIGNIYQKKLTF